MRPPQLKPQEDTVLRLLAKGKRSGQIAKVLGVSPGRISQIITDLVQLGVLVRLPRSSYQPYQLTLLAEEIFSDSPEGRETLNTPTYNGLHKISFRFNLVKCPDSFQPDKFIDLNNWKQGITHFKNLEMRTSTHCLECWWDERKVKDPIDAEEMATLRANLMKRNLEKLGFVFKGDPFPNRSWKHSIDDPVIQALDPGYLKGEDFIVDNTPKPNTLHLSKAEKVRSHLDTGEKVEEMRKEITDLKQLFDQVIVSNTEVVKSIKDLIKSFTKPQENLTPKEIETDSQMYG